MPQSYQTSYTVNGGATGLGGVHPSDDVLTQEFQVSTDNEAWDKAFWYTHFLSMEHLLNPTTGKTVVTLVSLTRPDGTKIDQREKARSVGQVKNIPRDKLEAMIGKQLPEGMLIMESDFIDHHLFYDDFKPMYERLGFLKSA